jgi:hypothetical protein
VGVFLREHANPAEQLQADPAIEPEVRFAMGLAADLKADLAANDVDNAGTS